MPRDINDSDNFYDWLTFDKDSNLERVRNSVQTPSNGDRNPVVIPTPQEPNLISDFAERKASQAEGRAIAEQNITSEANWSSWHSRRMAVPFAISALVYIYFIR